MDTSPKMHLCKVYEYVAVYALNLSLLAKIRNTVAWKYFVGKKFSWVMNSTKFIT